MLLHRKKDRPIVVAHRGSSGSAPENTLTAIHRAVEQGADMVEVDVRMTRDFFLVVLHDQDIRRTTNGEGLVWDYTLQELRTFDAGSWFSPKFKGERIPTLRQVMDALPPHVALNIEVKTDGEPRKRLAMEEATILAIMEKKMEDRTIVSSFDHDYLKRFHHLYPAIKTAALYMSVRDVAATPSKLHRSLGTSAFICSKTQLRKRFVEDAKQCKSPVACYTVNTVEELGKVIAYDIDAVITDHPAEILKAVKPK